MIDTPNTRPPGTITSPDGTEQRYWGGFGPPAPEVIGLVITDATVTVTFRRRSHSMYLTNPPRPAPDEVWRETYSITGLTLESVVHGKHNPQYTVNESVTFPDDNAASDQPIP